jgi:hypothetical protein
MANEGVIRIDPIKRRTIEFTLSSLSGYMPHRFGDVQRGMIRSKKEGKKTKNESRMRPFEPAQEAEDATYRLADGRPGVPCSTLRNSLVDAAHKDIGIEKTLVRKAIFIIEDGRDRGRPEGAALIALAGSEPIMREDIVRVPAKTGSADLRYRYFWAEWSLRVRMEYDADLIRPDDILNLAERAGFGVGIGEWRPQKNGEYGRYMLKRDDVVLS